MKYELKLDINYFDDVKKGKKNFEIRKKDRDFQIGDILVLHAWTNDTEKYQTWGKGTYLSWGTMHSDKPLFSDVKFVDEPISDYFPVPDFEMADTITVKVNSIWTLDTMFTENGYVDDMENAIDLDLYEKVLDDCFERDVLPIGYVVMATEVVE